MQSLPTTKQLKDWGANLGHLRKVMHPSFKPYVLEVKEKVVLIDLEKTISQLKKTIDFLKKNKIKMIVVIIIFLLFFIFFIFFVIPESRFELIYNLTWIPACAGMTATAIPHLIPLNYSFQPC